MKTLIGRCALVAFVLVLSACAGSHRTHTEGRTRSTGTQVSSGTISSSRLILGGHVRCTATVATPVEAGHAVDLRFSLHNISGGSARASIQEGSTWLVLKGADGTRYDTRTAVRDSGSLGGPYRPPLRIPAGTTKTMASPAVFARWRGPLRITPGCEQQALPVLPVQVTAPGPPPDDQTAIADVVAATGHLLDRCRPQKPEVAVEGQIAPPTGDGPAMEARCSVSLRPQGPFLVAQVLVVIPPTLRGVHVVQPYDTLSFKTHRRPYEAIAWELVVTRKGAVTVAGFNHDATRAANRMAPEWTWNWSTASWSGPGSARCGYEGFAGGPTLDLISVCP